MVDELSTAANEACDQRIRTTLRIRTETNPVIATSTSVLPPDQGAPQPQDFLAQMTRLFLEGANAHKRSTETVVASTTGKFSESKMARLQGWCGLRQTERGMIPEIWEKIQQSSEKEEVKCVLEKHFDTFNKSVEEPVHIYFSDRLIEDLTKLRLSPSKDPDVLTCHLGISILAVPTVTVTERTQRDEDTRMQGTATMRTLADIKAARKGPPPIPTSYDAGMRLLRQYRIFLQELFGKKCEHLTEVHLIYLSLRSLQNRSLEKMGKKDWAHIIWAIVVDARQYFGTYTDSDDILAERFPVSNLGTMRSLIQSNTELCIRDTPQHWLPQEHAPLKQLPRAPALGKRTQTELVEKGVAGTEKNPLVPELIDQPDVENKDMHPIFQAMFSPLEQRNIPLSVSKICKACNLYGIGKLKRIQNRRACYRWMFGRCKSTCPSGHEHLTASEIPDDFASELCHQIKDGIQAIIAVADGRTIDEPNKKRFKAEGDNA